MAYLKVALIIAKIMAMKWNTPHIASNIPETQLLDYYQYY